MFGSSPLKKIGESILNLHPIKFRTLTRQKKSNYHLNLMKSGEQAKYIKTEKGKYGNYETNYM